MYKGKDTVVKTIKIKYVDQYSPFDQEASLITSILRERYDVVFSEKPDYVFSAGIWGFPNEFLKYEKSIRIFGTGENLCPDFNAFDYAWGFDYLKFDDRYMRYPLCFGYQDDWELMKKKHLITEDEIAGKTEFCAFVVSKPPGKYSSFARKEIFDKLSNYKIVHSGGRYLNNIGLRGGVKDKLEFQKKHKFVIAFENTSHKGYCTEKIVQAFAAGAIPIYWGDTSISNIFNEKAFINCHEYSSFDDVVSAVREIDEDHEKYISMLREPALIDENIRESEFLKFKSFLYHIFDQDYIDAFRRDYVGYGKMHCDELKKGYHIRKIPVLRSIYNRLY